MGSYLIQQDPYKTFTIQRTAKSELECWLQMLLFLIKNSMEIIWDIILTYVVWFYRQLLNNTLIKTKDPLNASNPYPEDLPSMASNLRTLSCNRLVFLLLVLLLNIHEAEVEWWFKKAYKFLLKLFVSVS